MYIKKIRMCDYKRFHDLTIDLENPKRIVALVGPNGCGKSSVFDAMMFSANSYGGTIGNGNPRDYHYHSLNDNPVKREDVTIEFDIGSMEYVYKTKNKSFLGNSIFVFRSSFRYNSYLNITITESDEDMLKNNYGASSASDVDARIEKNYRFLLAKYNNYRDQNDVRPSEARSHIIDELNDSISKCLDLKIYDLGNVESGRGTLYFVKNDSNSPFSFDVLSAGEKEVVDLLLDLYIKKDYYDESIYIFDELELHLNTSIQRTLLIEINKIVPPNCQIWIATHSIGFLRALQVELNHISQIINFENGNKWATEEYILKPICFSRCKWQELLSVALDDLSKLICPKTIVYCEGRDKPGNDGSEKGFDAIVYNTIFSKKYPDILFISSGGNTELDQRSGVATAIFTKIFPELQILVLKDMDMNSGNHVDLEIREKYLKKNPSNHRVLKRFEIENYLYDKEVLKKYCQKNELKFNEEEYDNIVNNIELNNVKDISNQIKKCCGLNENLSTIEFKKNLASCIDENMNIYTELESVIFY